MSYSGPFEERQSDGTVIRGFTDACDPNEDWAQRYAEWMCEMSMAEYHAQIEHDEECRRYEPNKWERHCKSKFIQLGNRVNRIPANTRRI